MKANNSGCETFLILCMFLAISTPAVGDVGGGSRHAITPYVEDQTVTADDVERTRQLAGSHRVIQDLRINDSHAPIRGEEIGLMYVENGEPSGEPSYHLEGVTVEGDPVIVDLGDVESLTLLRVHNRWFRTDRALFEVMVFPSLSPRELVGKSPSYTELRDDHAEVIRLWLDLEDEDDAELSLVGKAWSEDDPLEVLCRVRDIAPDRTYALNYSVIRTAEGMRPAIWWAIQSVARDESYPFRYQPAER